MGISSGNDSMFLVGSHEVKVIRTWTENPRVGSSILSLGTSNFKHLRNIRRCFFSLSGSQNGHNLDGA